LEDKTTYIEFVQAQLEEWIMSINEFEEELEVEDESIQQNYQDQLTQIQIKIDVLNELLEQLKRTSVDHWLEAKEIIDIHWKELKSAIDDAPFISIN
jgi:hypothetical protein